MEMPSSQPCGTRLSARTGLTLYEVLNALQDLLRCWTATCTSQQSLPNSSCPAGHTQHQYQGRSDEILLDPAAEAEACWCQRRWVRSSASGLLVWVNSLCRHAPGGSP